MRSIPQKILIDVGFGVAFPQGFRFKEFTLEEEPLKLELEARFSSKAGRFIVRSVTVAAETDEYEINGSRIRAIQFNETLSSAMVGLHYFDIEKHSLSVVPALAYVPENRLEIIAAGPTENTLTAVAKLHRIATVMRANQAVHVQRALQIPYPTAANWITRARQLKLIEDRENPSYKIKMLRVPRDINVMDFFGTTADHIAGQ